MFVAEAPSASYRRAHTTSPPNVSTPPHAPLVALCIPTFRRPENLKGLLANVCEIDREGIDLHIIVVDNDAGQSARSAVTDALALLKIPFTYDCVEEQSLPLVRNRLVELAIAMKSDWIWFVDDDQLVEPDALHIMLRTAYAHDAAGVIPRVPHIFEPGTRPWGQWSGIFDEVHRRTGKPSRNLGTSGVLLRRTAVGQIPHPFDDRLRLTGGSDGLFFARFGARGFTVVGCDEAVLYDRLHSSRNNPRWLLHRALRIGLVKGFIVNEVEPSIRKSLTWIGLGGGYAVANLITGVLTLPLGPPRSFRYWVRAARGAGTVAGTLCPNLLLRQAEYRVVHGS